MDESPLIALRSKRDSTLARGLRLLKEKSIDAFVTAGNTGAFISAAKINLGVFPKLLRPALLALMPTKKKPLAVLDVGANVDVKVAHLIQFAHLGATYQIARGIAKPSVGILNIGSEPLKGTSELRLAYQHLKNLPNPPFRFAGNIEGKSVFDGDVDVLITDGFTGNIFLKTAEGIANLILDRLQARIPASISQEIEPQLSDLKRHLHYAEYPGALLIGVKGICIKCHGYTTPEGFINGVKGAVEFASANFLQTLEKLY
jgi:glycerol-3-phosphate acyltransferase PlsX